MEESPNHKPLIIKGARQVGKTTLVKKFAEDNYANVYYLDFRKDIESHRILM